MGFDPYEQWLQVPPGRRPPSHYDLLGLPDDETDQQRIDEAASARIEQVRKLVLGRHGEDAIRIVAELSQALDCLIDPEKREAYDRGTADAPPAETEPPGPIRPPVETLAGRAWAPVAANPALFAGWTCVAVMAAIAPLLVQAFSRPGPSAAPEAVFVDATVAVRPQDPGEAPADRRPIEPVTAEPPAPRPAKVEEVDELDSGGLAGAAGQLAGQTPPNSAGGDPPDVPGAAAAAGGAAVEPPVDEDGPVPWKTAALRFAQQHSGVFLDEAPLTSGKAAIPFDVLPGSPQPGSLLLSAGELYLDTGAYPFGAGFAEAAATRQHEIPRLADELRLQSVRVVLHDWQTGAFVCVEGAGRTSPSEVVDEENAEMGELRTRLKELQKQLMIYRSRKAGRVQRNVAFRALTQLAGITIPEEPLPPESWAGTPAEYGRALSQYNRERAAYQYAINSVIPSATKAVPMLEDQIKAIQKGRRNRETRLRRENEQALAALRRRCRKISVVVYP